MKPYWTGVFPAITTQMTKSGALDLDATASHIEALLASGVTGMIMLGSLGENQMLTADEKRRVLAFAVQIVRGRVPVLSGIAETGTAEAVSFARDCERHGADGFMLMPAMIYKTPDPHETLAHFRTVARATGLPIMVYNNPISYGNDITPEMFAGLADVKNFVALKESSGNTRRITDLHNVIGGRYAIFTGVDDLALEAAILGIDGWVAGTGIAFPAENQYLWELMQRGEWEKARAILPLVRAATAPRCASEVRAIHQARRAGVRPRKGVGARPAPPARRHRAQSGAEDHPRRDRRAAQGAEAGSELVQTVRRRKIRGAHASRMLVAASRRNELCKAWPHTGDAFSERDGL